jgi:hypothetical protein
MKNRLFATAAAASVLAVAAAPALLVRCGDGQSALAGRWEKTDEQRSGGFPDAMYLLGDGRGVVPERDIGGCTWKAEGDRLYIFVNGSSDAYMYGYSLSGTTLTLTRHEWTCVYAKQKK